MEHTTAITVRYAETDQMGIAHHANYAVWFEAGRTDFMKNAGFPYSDIEAAGVLLPLYALDCKFLSPAKYEDTLFVMTAVKHLSRVRIGFSYRVVHSADMRLLATGETLHAFTDRCLKPVNAQKILPEIYAVLENGSKNI